MTVEFSTSRNSYNCNGSQTVFPYTFKILDETHLQVILRDSGGSETTLVLNTDYTVDGVEESEGGNVTTATAYATGYSLVILRNVTIDQLVDYVENDSFPAEIHEQALDKLTMILQSIKEEFGRCLKMAKSSPVSGSGVEANAIASHLLGWDAAAGALANYAMSSVTITDFVNLYNDYGNDVAAAITAIGSSKKTVIVDRNTDISADVSSPSNIVWMPINGAQFVIAVGKVFTVNSPTNLMAPASQQIFSGAGTVAFITTALGVVYPEWWGVSATSAEDAINAALNTYCPVQLQAKTYTIDGTIKIPNWSRLQGQNKLYTKIATTSAINMIESASVDVPATTLGIQIHDLSLDGGNVATCGIEIGAESRSYLNSEMVIADVRIGNILQGMVLDSPVYSVVRDCHIWSGNTVAGTTGIKLAYQTQSCLFQNVIVHGFETNVKFEYTAGSTASSIVGTSWEECYIYCEATDTHTVNLLLMEDSYNNSFRKCIFECLYVSSITEVLLRAYAASTSYNSVRNIFEDCRWNGNAAGTNRIQIGQTSGGTYKAVYGTIIRNCHFLNVATGNDIVLDANSSGTLIDRCWHYTGYAGTNVLPPLISGNVRSTNSIIIPFISSYIDNLDHASSGSGGQNLLTYNIPAYTLRAEGGFKVTVAGTKTGSNGTKGISLYFSSGITINAVANDENDWGGEMTVCNTAPNAQRVHWMGWNDTTIRRGYEEWAVNTAISQNVIVYANPANAGDTVTLKMFKVEFF